ncbi:MAG TPA: S8/S53 family peptidase, partial [Candidatus Thermoplasmatota archaeon]|nr:S8/S53 family peptidase [Candidatus Thermoplasmatota archaeon]
MAWRLSTLGIALALLTPVVLLAPALAAEAAVQDEFVVAVFDTGINPSHQEFSPGQVVAWWDFSSTKKTAAAARDPYQNAVNGQVPTWDPYTAPYDDHGHGTATASLVAGNNVGGCSGPKSAYAPNTKLAILKVIKGTSLDGDLALAMRYATDVLKVDAMSISIGSIIPTWGAMLGDDVYGEIKRAHGKGIPVVFSAGNGLANVGLAPYPSETSNWGDSPYAIVVGSGTRTGTTATSTTGNMDPDVSAWSDSVCVARHNSNTQYTSMSGTSFSAPLVAGMAATLVKEARANGQPSGADRIELILKHAAKDTVAPYAREGWGYLGATEFQNALTAARTGTLPTYRTFTGLPVNENAAYEDTVATPLRQVHGSSLAYDLLVLRAPTAAPTFTGQGVLGPSLPVGVFEMERYTVTLAAGATVQLGL